MPTPTLGFQNDTQINKSEIAQTQLKEAIALFLDKNFLCAITLAGAAEAILAGLLNSRGEHSVVEASFKSIQTIREATGLTIMGNRQKNEIFNQWNTARNTLKHHNNKDEEAVTINLFDEAYWMIKRALANTSKLGIRIDNELDFENWCLIKLHI